MLSDRELLRRLVAFDTTSAHSNLPLIDAVAEYLDRPGIRQERVLSECGTKANLIAAAGPERSDRAGLMLSGHTDVVPAGGGWQSDPFALTETSETFVARGACDMKGFLAIAINRLAAASSRSLSAPLALVFTYDEEVGTLGARRISELWSKERALPERAIIGEPTSLRPVRMHKGHLRLRLIVHGKSAHSGYPHLGVNAIEWAGKAIGALARLRAELAAERVPMGDEFPDVPYVPLNVGRIEGGVAVNVVPERAVLDVGIRLLPGMRSDVFVKRVHDAMDDALANIPFDLTITSESPPMALDAGADHYRALLEASGEGAGHGVSFATDAGWLQSLGLACVIWGPGSIAVAHRPNEFLPVAEFVRAGAVVDRMIGRFCDDAEPA